MPSTITLFLFEPFINRLKVGDLIDINTFLIPVKKSAKFSKFSLKELRAAVFNYTYASTVFLGTKQIFNALGLLNESSKMTKLQHFRSAPALSKLETEVREVSLYESVLSSSTLASSTVLETETK